MKSTMPDHKYVCLLEKQTVNMKKIVMVFLKRPHHLSTNK